MKSLPLALAALLVFATAALAGRTEPEGIIRCPDWQSLVANLTPATPADGQDNDRFRQRAGSSNAKPSSAASEGPKPQSFDETVRELAFPSDGRASVGEAGKPEHAKGQARLEVRTPASAISRDGPRNVASAPAPAKPEPRQTREPKRASVSESSSDVDGTTRLAETGPAGSGSVTASGPARTITTLPLPEWKAESGEFLADVLTRWGTTAGYTVLVDTSDAWKLGVDIRIRGSFEAAVDELVYGLGHDGSPPRVRLYPNAVLRLGGPL